MSKYVYYEAEGWAIREDGKGTYAGIFTGICREDGAESYAMRQNPELRACNKVIFNTYELGRK